MTSTPTSPAATSSATKEHLLDAAELLIADHGIDGASVRAITEAAGANLAAVNYHFGSKEGLVKAAFERRLRPINRQRLEMLDECLAQDGGPRIEAVVRAFVTPPLRILRRQDAPNFGRCMIRALADPGSHMKELLLSNFSEVISRFAEALQAALPGADPEDIFWCFHFMSGCMAYTLGMGHLIEEYSKGACKHGDSAAISERLVRFVSAGMRAGRSAPEAI